MKKSIQIIATAVGLLFGNAAFAQLDSVYIVKGDSVLAVYATTDLDSVIFYNPNPIDTTTNSTTTDADGNVYTSSTIGTQEWMAENLRTTKYSDGTSIPNVTEGWGEWRYLETGAWCHYDNDSSQYEPMYGKLYNWYAVSDSRNVCPTGWHVPTDAEWDLLTDYLAANGHSGTEGRALKATSGWIKNGTDNYGWLGLPGGNLGYNGVFYNIGYYGSWWSSSQDDTDNAWYRYMGNGSVNVRRSDSNKKNGYSVRCLKD